MIAAIFCTLIGGPSLAVVVPYQETRITTKESCQHFGGNDYSVFTEIPYWKASCSVFEGKEKKKRRAYSTEFIYRSPLRWDAFAEIYCANTNHGSVIVMRRRGAQK